MRCRKSTRRYGAKHISKSKCIKHTTFGPLLEVPMWKKCTPLWCEAHFDVKMYKTPGVQTTFGGSDVEKVCAVVARSTFRSQNVKTLRVQTTFGGSDVASLHRNTTTITTQLHSTTLHYTPLHSTLNYTTLHYTTLHYLPLHYTPLHNNYNYNYRTTLHYTPLH